MTTKSPLFWAYTALALVSFFWGTTYLAIKIGVEFIPLLLLAGVRQLVAGALICFYFLIKGAGIPKWADFKLMLIPSLLMITMGNGLVTWAEQHVSSGLTAILCAMNPVWVMILTLLFVKTDQLKPKLIIGVLLGFGGVLIIFSDQLKDFTNLNYVLGISAILLANMSWAGGTIYISKVKHSLQAIYAAGIQMFCAGVFMSILSLIFEDPFSTKFSFEGLFALLYLIVFGSLIAYGAFIYMLNHLSPTKASIYAYANTIVAVLLGWLLLNEQLTYLMLTGTIVTVIGVYLVNSSKATNQ